MQEKNKPFLFAVNFLSTINFLGGNKLWNIRVFFVVISDLVANVNTMMGLGYFPTLRTTMKIGTA
jgi:hypothetical protein